MSATHIPVMLDEVMEALKPHADGVYVDGTFGRGGYSEAILKTGAQVIAFDRDESAIKAGEPLKQKYAPRLTLIPARFGTMDTVVKEPVDGVALDLGVSSPQLDEAARGFSFRNDGPLDMRMGQSGETAEHVVNSLPEKELADVLFHYGEERLSRRVARALVEARSKERITRTVQLAALIRAVVPPSRDGIDPATRSFQALRIYVNQEMDELEKGLYAATALLKKGGRLVVVSFHSLEDRVVKNVFRKEAGTGTAFSRHQPRPTNTAAPRLRILTTKPVTPSAAERQRNPRAASAKLRAAERIFVDSTLESLGKTPDLPVMKGTC